MEEFERIKQAMAAAEPDVPKARQGNKAAGTRVRQRMQEIKDLAQEIRRKLLALRGGSGAMGAMGAVPSPLAGTRPPGAVKLSATSPTPGTGGATGTPKGRTPDE
jgi:hypothetical protein